MAIDRNTGDAGSPRPRPRSSCWRVRLSCADARRRRRSAGGSARRAPRGDASDRGEIWKNAPAHSILTTARAAFTIHPCSIHEGADHDEPGPHPDRAGGRPTGQGHPARSRSSWRPCTRRRRGLQARRRGHGRCSLDRRAPVRGRRPRPAARPHARGRVFDRPRGRDRLPIERPGGRPRRWRLHRREAPWRGPRDVECRIGPGPG